MVTLLLLLLSDPASARDAVELQVIRKAQEGLGAPGMTILSHVRGHIELSMRCADRTYLLAEAISPGGSYPLSFEGLSRGHHACSGALSLSADDGTVGQMPVSIEVDILPPLGLTVASEELDLEARHLTLHATRPLSHVRLEVLGERGAQLGGAESEISGLVRVELSWDQQPGEVLKLLITGEDLDHLPGQLELSPWHYDIPHEDVVFETGQYEVLPREAPKLEQAWADLEGVLARYGSVVEVKLFVAGYTDTVGNPGANLSLSRSRARAIAEWFRARGFTGPIAYQGFGEQVLAVATPDETPEGANRRALYVLAAEPPPVSTSLPRLDWTRLP